MRTYVLMAFCFDVALLLSCSRRTEIDIGDYLTFALKANKNEIHYMLAMVKDGATMENAIKFLNRQEGDYDIIPSDPVSSISQNMINTHKISNEEFEFFTGLNPEPFNTRKCKITDSTIEIYEYEHGDYKLSFASKRNLHIANSDTQSISFVGFETIKINSETFESCPKINFHIDNTDVSFWLHQDYGIVQYSTVYKSNIVVGLKRK